VRLRGATTGQVAEARVRWLDPRGGEAQENAATVKVGDLGGDFAGASPRLQVCYAAAYFAESLRRSPFAREVRLADLATVADDAFHATDDPQVSELAELIRRSG
jgi:Ca-activated chloride channel family protein